MSFEDIVSTLFKGWLQKPSVSSPSSSQDQQQLEQSYLETKKEFEQSHLATIKAYDFAVYVVEKAIEYAQEESATPLQQLPQPIVEQLLDITVSAIQENHIFDFPYIDFSKPIPASKQIEYKRVLETVSLRVYDNDYTFGLFQTSFSYALSQFLLSSESFIRHGTQEGSFTTSVISFQKNLDLHVERMIVAFFTEANAQYGLFNQLRAQLLSNADVASGFRPDRTDEERERKTCTLPAASKLSGQEMVNAYLENTELHELFSATVPFHIPISTRVEHMHIIAGTGHGKTQLIQRLILDDLEAGRGFMVIDSQGDMLQKIIMLDYFDPEKDNSLSDKLIYINPEQVEYPAALNMFSLNTDTENVSELDKQILVNSAVDLYQYLFGALFGAELTSKQGIIFRYLAKLIAEIPNASIHTLRALLEDARPYKHYMEQLDGSAKAFFKTQFFSPSFNQTKQQVLQRLWMVLSNQSLANLFSSKHNSVDLVSALQEGKIVLVNTSKRLLQDYGSATLGRFFIALLAQAVIQRGAQSEYERDPYMVYIDEAQEYFDEKIENMLHQARKQSVGICFSHQTLFQLGGYKNAAFSSTSVKIAGGISAKDAKDLAYEMKTDTNTLLSVQKTDTYTEFACYIKNQLPTAIPISFDFGQMEQAPKISREGYVANHLKNIDKYCSNIDDLSFGEEPESTQAPSSFDDKVRSNEEDTVDIDTKEQTKNKEKPTQAKSKTKSTSTEKKAEESGITTHRYLQNLVKKIGQKKGFYSVIESPVLDGFGSVDVALEGHGKKIAVEVTIHTQGKWESSNIAKCLSAGFDVIALLSTDNNHLEQVKNIVKNEFYQYIQENKLLFLLPDELTEYLTSIQGETTQQGNNFSGYTVKTRYVASNEIETKLREEAIAKILLKKN